MIWGEKPRNINQQNAQMYLSYVQASNIKFDLLLYCALLYSAYFVQFSMLSSFPALLSCFSRLATLPIGNLPLPLL